MDRDLKGRLLGTEGQDLMQGILGAGGRGLGVKDSGSWRLLEGWFVDVRAIRERKGNSWESGGNLLSFLCAVWKQRSQIPD